MSAHDFNSVRENLRTTGNFAGGWRLQYARRDVCVCAAHGVFSEARIPFVCASLPWRSETARLLVSRSVFVFGVCSTHVSRELARHRDVPAGRADKALS